MQARHPTEIALTPVPPGSHRPIAPTWGLLGWESRSANVVRLCSPLEHIKVERDGSCEIPLAVTISLNFPLQLAECEIIGIKRHQVQVLASSRENLRKSTLVLFCCMNNSRVIEIDSVFPEQKPAHAADPAELGHRPVGAISNTSI